jgi:hypothetical protein
MEGFIIGKHVMTAQIAFRITWAYVKQYHVLSHVLYESWGLILVSNLHKQYLYPRFATGTENPVLSSDFYEKKMSYSIQGSEATKAPDFSSIALFIDANRQENSSLFTGNAQHPYFHRLYKCFIRIARLHN